ncbi:MAG: hypothetical protein A2Y17_00930 [Clostridiales bacterium GWF2_38_85]|nr:MAG: hypothetical protein A2Y17_00930 [Clostridiales bacterium GWF2_38_85]HBL84543.1 hypothetical protein [Clostridiales bacterium]
MEHNLSDILNFESWQLKLQNEKEPILLYGMGDGADKLLSVLESIGVSINGVFASDGFVRGQSFRGMPVRTLAEAEAEFGNFTAVQAFALHGKNCDILRNFKHRLISPNISVSGKSICDKTFIIKNIEAFEYAYSRLADDESRAVMESVLSYNISGDISHLFEVCSEKYRFEKHSDVHIDIGAYDGDTVIEFAKENDSYSEIIAVEPDEKNYKKLSENTSNIRDVNCINAAAWSGDGTGRLSQGKGRGSTLENEGNPIRVISIDNIAKRKKVGSIKIDSEGSDKEVLYGAVNTICGQTPQLAVAVYHRAEDMFAIPQLLWYYNNKYKIYLRKIDYVPPWDIFCYAKV